MIVVSPYANHAYVSHTWYEFGSILRCIEDRGSEMIRLCVAQLLHGASGVAEAFVIEGRKCSPSGIRI
jgi:hypothetical protein